ncbi:MAG TPA: hypothetical protein VEP66_10455 [Myxococcales bacterium]|nr:hypothetical protein [Myxococcales bacterium]
MRGAAALALVAAVSCSRGQDKHAAAPRAGPVDAGPPPEPAFSSAGLDISWLVGTWERQSDPKEWLLFNAPKEVGVIKGKPPTLTKRGEFVPNGRQISIFFRGVGGVTEERVFEANPDHSELREAGSAPASYRRGSPP